LQSPLHLQLALRAVASILPMIHIIGKHIVMQQEVCQSHQAHPGQRQERVIFFGGMSLERRAVVDVEFERQRIHIDQFITRET
jgi:hypothetical protein